MRILWASLILVLTLGACAQVSQPFRHSYTGADTTALRLLDTGMVRVLPLQGASRPTVESFSDGLVEALKLRNVPATAAAISNPTYWLQGFVQTPEADQDRAIIWRFAGPNKETLAEYRQPISATEFQWVHGDGPLMAKTMQQAADLVALLIQDEQEAEIAQNPVDDQVYFVVDAVVGVHGDGAAALHRAMTLTLGQYGAVVRPEGHPAAYHLLPAVDIAPPHDGQQRVHIQWRLLDAQDQELGVVNQYNKVPAGSLEGEWGSMAFMIAQAAIQGIGNMVEEHRTGQAGFAPPASGQLGTITPPWQQN